jgi:hypothetical protein
MSQVSQGTVLDESGDGSLTHFEKMSQRTVP